MQSVIDTLQKGGKTQKKPSKEVIKLINKTRPKMEKNLNDYGISLQ